MPTKDIIKLLDTLLQSLSNPVTAKTLVSLAALGVVALVVWKH